MAEKCDFCGLDAIEKRNHKFCECGAKYTTCCGEWKEPFDLVKTTSYQCKDCRKLERSKNEIQSKNEESDESSDTSSVRLADTPILEGDNLLNTFKIRKRDLLNSYNTIREYELWIMGKLSPLVRDAGWN